MKKNRLVQKFGGNTALESVSFVGGWMCFFFAHFEFRVDRIPELREVKPRSARNKLCVAIQHDVCISV